ncbi:MAG: hypothetical protein JO301_12465 [Chitinophagaceae bacterium]|nr:hypothetical protein [Chitinophagaceae bacterium]
MKKIFFGAIIALAAACTPQTVPPPAPMPDPLPIPNSVIGNWKLAEVQSPGTGGPGVWAAASPSGQTMNFSANGTVSGTAFPAATSFQQVDAVTLKITDPADPAGYRLFYFKIDTAARTLVLSIRLASGAICTEGCGGYKFVQ